MSILLETLKQKHHADKKSIETDFSKLDRPTAANQLAGENLDAEHSTGHSAPAEDAMQALVSQLDIELPADLEYKLKAMPAAESDAYVPSELAPQPLVLPDTFNESMVGAQSKFSDSKPLNLVRPDAESISMAKIDHIEPSSSSQQSIYNRALFSTENRLFAQTIKPFALVVLTLLMGFLYVIYLTGVERQTQQLAYQQQIEPYKQLLLVDSVSIATPSNEAPNQSIGALDGADTIATTKDSKEIEPHYANPPVTQKASLSTIVSQPIASSPKRIAEKVSDQHPLAIHVEKTQQTVDLLMMAYQAWQMGDLVQAEAIYQALLDKQPNLKDALWGMLALSQVNGSDLSTVHSYAARLRLVAPYDDAVRFETDRILMPSNLTDRHESTLSLAQSVPVDTAQASYRLGVYYAEQKRWSEAQLAFFEAVKIAPQQVDYRINLGVSYDQLGKYHLAMQHYQQALSVAHPSAIHQELTSIRERLTFLQTYYGMEN